MKHIWFSSVVLASSLALSSCSDGGGNSLLASVVNASLESSIHADLSGIL